MEDRDKVAIKILVKVARFNGICPSEKPTNFYSFYQICMMCATLGFSVSSIYYAGSKVYSTISTIHIFIDLLTSLFITIEGSSLQITSLLFSTKWRSLLKEFNFKNGNKNYIASICFEMFILHFLFIGRIIWNFFVWSNILGLKFYSYYIFRSIHEYHTMITIVLMVHINRIIKKRFCVMNEILSNTTKKLEWQMHYVRKVEIIYRKLMLVLENFNYVFGYSILFIIGNAVAVILESLRYALQHHSFSSTEDMLIMGWSLTSIVFVLVSFIIKYIIFNY